MRKFNPIWSIFLLLSLSSLNSYAFQTDTTISSNNTQSNIINDLNILNTKARSLIRSNPDSCIIIAQEVFKKSTLLDLEKVMAASLNTMGIAYHYLGKLDTALLLNSQALGVFGTLKDSVNYSNVLINIGNIYFEQGDYTTANKKYEKAYKIFLRKKDLKGQAKALNNLGNTYNYQGNYKAALENYFSALEIENEKRNPKGEAICQNNIGILFHKLNKDTEALRYFTNALQLYDSLGKDLNKAVVMNQIASSYLALNLNDSALFTYERALKISKNISHPALTAVIENNLGELLFSKKEYLKAVPHFKNAFSLNQMLNDKEGMALNLIGLGKILNQQKDYNSAIEKLHRAYETGREINSLEIIKFSAQELSIAYEAKGNLNQALSLFKVFKTMQDSSLNQSNIEKITTMQMQYNFDLEQKNREFLQLQKDLQHREELKEMRLRQLKIASLSIGIILILLILFLLYNFRQKNRVNKLKIEINRNIQRLLGQQMNPHFIFNTLKSIQNFILKNDTKQSNLYLTRFSKLIRKILENSQSEFISLKDEMEALELYIQLEQLRLNNNFGYEIIMDNNIDSLNLKIPSLLFQPFAENAIWHGISPKNGFGKITVEIKLKGGFIQCCIQDNGVGRKKQSPVENKMHKSLGSSITTKRIELLNNLYKTHISPEISDLRDADGKPAGTSVKFSLPGIQ